MHASNISLYREDTREFAAFRPTSRKTVKSFNADVSESTNYLGKSWINEPHPWLFVATVTFAKPNSRAKPITRTTVQYPAVKSLNRPVNPLFVN